MVSRLALLLTCSFVLSYIAESSETLCPKSQTSTFFWHPYEDMESDRNGTMTGKLRGFLETSMQSCCSKMALPKYAEILKKDAKNMENLIRKDQGSKELKMYFPVFGDRNSEVRYERPFIGLYDSPGIVVFVPANNEKMWNGFLAVGTQLWQVITLSFLLAGISGILVWFLVRILTVYFA